MEAGSAGCAVEAVRHAWHTSLRSCQVFAEVAGKAVSGRGAGEAIGSNAGSGCAKARLIIARNGNASHGRVVHYSEIDSVAALGALAVVSAVVAVDGRAGVALEVVGV